MPPIRELQPYTYTVPEAAEVLRLSDTRVRELIAAGSIPTLRGLGRRTLISRKALAEWVERQSGPPPLCPHCGKPIDPLPADEG